jgi:hypothetical protein
MEIHPVVYLYLTLTLIIAALIYIKEDSGVSKVDCSKFDSQENPGIRYFIDRSECYFSQSFENATTKFLESLKSLSDVEIKELPVVEKYSTYAAILKGNQEKFLIHISGTHGVEGFAGSAIQSSIIDYFSRNKLYTVDSTIDRNTLPTILFVHALNPYGFANLRRTNEDNIDINRNFLTEDQFAFVKNRDANFASYVDFDPFFNPTKRPFKDNKILNDFYSWLHVGYGSLLNGFGTARTALLAGNYFKQKGIGFGGFELSKSAKNLIDITNYLNITQNAKKLVFIDVHTGLGPSGVDTFFTTFRQDEKKKIHINDIFPVDFDIKTNKPIGGLKEYITMQTLVADKKVLNNDSENKKNSCTNNDELTDDKKKHCENKNKVINNELKKERINDKAEVSNVGAGYELTVGTTSESFCSFLLSPDLKNTDKLCLTQVKYININIITRFEYFYNNCKHYK